MPVTLPPHHMPHLVAAWTKESAETRAHVAIHTLAIERAAVRARELAARLAKVPRIALARVVLPEADRGVQNARALLECALVAAVEVVQGIHNVTGVTGEPVVAAAYTRHLGCTVACDMNTVTATSRPKNTHYIRPRMQNRTEDC